LFLDVDRSSAVSHSFLPQKYPLLDARSVLFQDVLDLLEYLDLNVLGLRKIIRKHDKQFDLQMGTMYFGSRMGQNSQLVQLYHQVLQCSVLYCTMHSSYHLAFQNYSAAP
jgi:SPX domain protein involved in polyphosphate accumulation